MTKQTHAMENGLLEGSEELKRRGRPSPAERSVVLAYHEILPNPSHYLYRVTSDQFRSHLDFLASLPAGSASQPRLTFDDGHRSNYEVAVPLLHQFGLKAKFFVLAGSVGANPNYISWSQAREMVAAGHDVQSHGWSHTLLTRCGPRELDQEIAQSKKELEDRLGVEVSSLSAPGGRWDVRVVEACARAGYKYLFHSNPWGSIQVSNGIFLQGRMMITCGMSAEVLKRRINPTRLSAFYFRIKQGAKEDLRSLIGDNYYHRLWRWFANSSPADGMEIQTGKSNGERRGGT